MRKVLNFVNDNKKIIIVVILVIVLVGTIYLMNGGRRKQTESVTTTTEKSATETKLSAILSSISGVGATDVMITENENGILGVVIVCEGADNIMTRNDILNAVSTALNIDKKIIAIYSMNV